MKESKVRGLIIKEAPMGDKDKRLIMLTREMGKISVIAKGALSPKSKWGAASQLFSYGDYVMSKGQSFYYIKEVQLIESFYALRVNLERLAYATFMAEVAETLILDGQENQTLMYLLLRGLMVLCKAESGAESLIADAFVWRALSESGFYPELHICRQCGRSLDVLPAQLEKVTFDFALGGAVCERCKASGAGVQLTSGGLRALQYIAEVPVEKIYSFQAEKEVQKQLDEAAVGYLLHQTERHYGSLDFIGNLRW
ncbi:MAG: DNA repair protein RecO [Lachnospiraceae bacterium]|jgi:DNA repair protein RecO (recombination protein O)|nr:DNA repair protein RecO [Lachnospiraceae bacterium]